MGVLESYLLVTLPQPLALSIDTFLEIIGLSSSSSSSKPVDTMSVSLDTVSNIAIMKRPTERMPNYSKHRKILEAINGIPCYSVTVEHDTALK